MVIPTRRTLTATVLALALPFGLAACGGDERASKDDFRSGVESIMTEVGFSREQAEAIGLESDQFDEYLNCIADEAYDDLSDDFVNGVAKGDKDAPASADDNAAMDSAVSACVEKMSQN